MILSVGVFGIHLLKNKTNEENVFWKTMCLSDLYCIPYFQVVLALQLARLVG